MSLSSSFLEAFNSRLGLVQYVNGLDKVSLDLLTRILSLQDFDDLDSIDALGQLRQVRNISVPILIDVSGTSLHLVFRGTLSGCLLTFFPETPDTIPSLSFLNLTTFMTHIPNSVEDTEEFSDLSLDSIPHDFHNAVVHPSQVIRYDSFPTKRAQEIYRSLASEKDINHQYWRLSVAPSDAVEFFKLHCHSGHPEISLLASKRLIDSSPTAQTLKWLISTKNRHQKRLIYYFVANNPRLCESVSYDFISDKEIVEEEKAEFLNAFERDEESSDWESLQRQRAFALARQAYRHNYFSRKVEILQPYIADLPPIEQKILKIAYKKTDQNKKQGS